MRAADDGRLALDMPAARRCRSGRSSRAARPCNGWVHPVTARSLLTLRPDTPEDTMGRARSDMGYALLGDMVAHAAEEPFDTYMRRAILRPLNISRAGYRR